ncbi:transcriptional regulator [Methylobacterium sp. WL30]|nr:MULTISPECIES: transcriptional regulator [unclassified Methylobacterium]TXN34152.1 transcriptional regulator [Methylobacterium sp. WL93]TXN45097.1 transcriptional regulator [Methylobacterium sp. WL119]TXN63268.1 transcriptional regulator [Methylobacterium sp. WL30]
MLTITGAQLRAARAFLRWTAQEVADASRLGVATVRRAELQDGPLSITAANAEAIRRALEAAGLEFIPENGGGAGIRFRERKA